MARLIDLTGKRFVRLAVTGRADHNDKHNQPRWKCICDCGKEVIVGGPDLRSGNTKSCGCLNRDRASETKSKQYLNYSGVHARLRRNRGPASRHLCFDCKRAATQWSYVGGCPEQTSGTNGRHVTVMGYCPVVHDDCYVPRCGYCHKAYDKQQRENRQGST